MQNRITTMKKTRLLIVASALLLALAAASQTNAPTPGKHIMKRLGLTERLTTKVEDTQRINQVSIDYNEVDSVIQKQRNMAKEYLKKNLEG